MHGAQGNVLPEAETTRPARVSLEAHSTARAPVGMRLRRETGAGEQKGGLSVEGHFSWDLNSRSGSWREKGQLVGKARELGTWRVLCKAGRDREYGARGRGGREQGWTGAARSP